MLVSRTIIIKELRIGWGNGPERGQFISFNGYKIKGCKIFFHAQLN